MEMQDYRELARLTAEHQARLSSSSFFFTGEDRLRVTSFNSAAGVTLAIEGRRIDPEGRLVAFAERHVPNTDRTVATSTFAIGEGFILNVQVRASAGTPHRGQCFAILEVVRGQTGAVVPIGVTSAVPKTEAIAILVEKNPSMLAAVFEIPPGTEPSLSTRVKMAQTSNVYALVKADGKFYMASKEIKVTLGGCGG